jgi:uncharacterized protein with GYD domain
MTVAFEQAAIKVEKAQEYAKLKAAIEQAFSAETAEQFLKQLDRQGIRVRDVDAVFGKKMLDGFGEPELDAQQVYQALTLSDQGLIREFYLSKLEGVDTALRHKYKKVYQYY